MQRTQVISKGQLLDHQYTLILVQKLKKNKLSVKNLDFDKLLFLKNGVRGDCAFFKFSAAPAHEYTDLTKIISQNQDGHSIDFTEILLKLAGASWHREDFQTNKTLRPI